MTPNSIQEVIETGIPHVLEPPRPLIRPITPASEFPIDALSDVLSAAATGIHWKTQAPMAMCAQSVLAAVTVAVQGQINVTLPTGQVKPVSQFYLSLAASGERKSTCDALAMHPIKKYEEHLRAQYDATYPSWKNKMDAWEKQRSQI